MRSGVALGLAAVVAVSGPSRAAQPGLDGPVPQPEGARVAAVSPKAAIAAFNALDGWVRALAAPEDAQAPQGLDAMTGCSIVLRLDHHVIGRATRFGGPGDLPRAARAAIAEAAPRLPVGHDALADQQLKDAAARITISLELGGTMIPVKLATFDDADEQLEPGLDGVAARFGDKLAGTFPGAMLVMNKTAGECLAAAISEASGDATLAIPGSPKDEAGIIAAAHNATYYRFRTVHLAQLDVGKSPAFLKRGGRVVEPFEIDLASLQTFAKALAENLDGRGSPKPEDGLLGGTYLPSQGRYESSASTLEAMLAVAAIGEWGSLAAGKWRDGVLEDARRTLNSAKDMARLDPVDASAWIVAAAALDGAPTPSEKPELRQTDSDTNADTNPIEPRIDPAARARVGAVVASCFDAQTGWLPQVRPGARGLVACALAIEATAPNLADDDRTTRRARATAAIESIYKDTPPKMFVSQAPWLGRAELTLAGDSKVLAFAAGLRDLREEVWKHQLTPDDAGPDNTDLVGGIVFTSSRNPLPTWRSAQPIILLAQIARDQRLTDDKEKMAEVSHLLASMRFLRQLMMDQTSAYAAEDPEAAVGGIRASLWDQRQPVEATAMTLMAVCEMMRTLGVKPQP